MDNKVHPGPTPGGLKKKFFGEALQPLQIFASKQPYHPLVALRASRFDVWRRSAWRGKRSNDAARRRYAGFELAAPPVYGVACLVYRQTN